MARPVFDGNLSTARNHKMDITKLRKPLRRLSLAFALILAILPVISLSLLAFKVLTGGETSVGPKALFVVSVLGGLAVIFIAIYVLIQKTKRVGIIIAILVFSVLGTYLGYEIFTKVIMRI